MIIPKWVLPVLAVVGASALFASGYGLGVKVEKARWVTAQAATVQKGNAELVGSIDRTFSLGLEHSKAQEERSETTKLIINDIHENAKGGDTVVVPDDWSLLFNAAATGKYVLPPASGVDGASTKRTKDGGAGVGAVESP